jgi:hypothetical protein
MTGIPVARYIPDLRNFLLELEGVFIDSFIRKGFFEDANVIIFSI